MRIIADLHIHSKYSRACSQDLSPENIALWAQKKGIGIIGTGDFTHPKWLSELKESLEEARPGLYRLRSKNAPVGEATSLPRPGRMVSAPTTLFLLSCEVSSIYKQGDKVRRIHNLFLAPNFEAVDRLIIGLEKREVNLKSDGRPIMGIHCDELVKIAKEADPEIEIIPAHAWTPHFGLFGSLSGFDSIEEAFGGQSKHIFALETGLSSDPKMNWQVEGLDKSSLISNSDAHSLRKIGREANVFEVDPIKLSYAEIIRVIRNKDPREFVCTLEFFPEEGKYHLDGHADCKFSCEPKETNRLKNICPVCGKKLLVGVLNRVDQLANREYGFTPPSPIPFKSIIPLEELIAETFGVGVQSKKVLQTYEKMVDAVGADTIRLNRSGKMISSPATGGMPFHSEFGILLDLSKEEIIKISSNEIAESIIRVREGRVKVEGGYDGVFGKIHIFSEEERQTVLRKPKQMGLF